MAEEKTKIVKCPNCGANMVWNAQIGKLECPYCTSQKEVEKHKSRFRNYYDCVKDGFVDSDGIVYRCPNCDAKTTIEGFDTAVKCPFCGSTNIVKTDELPGLKPDGILPFKLNADGASEFAKKWLKKKIWTPNKCKKNFNPTNFHGVYIPNFVFNTQTVSKYNGRLGEYYYVTVGSDKNRHQERRIRYFNVSGSLNQLFQNVFVEASTHVEQKELGKITPYDTKSFEEYTPDYLAGYSSERYSTGLKQSFDEAKLQIEPKIRKMVLDKYNADVVDYLSISTTYHDIDFVYVLLPIWIANYGYKNKNYRFLVNGQTGKCTGKTPISAWKVSLAVLLGLGILAVAIYFIFFHNGGTIEINLNSLFNQTKML